METDGDRENCVSVTSPQKDHEDGKVVAIDVTVIGNGEEAAEQIRRKEHGWGTLGKLEQARRHRAEEWERCKVSSW